MSPGGCRKILGWVTSVCDNSEKKKNKGKVFDIDLSLERIMLIKKTYKEKDFGFFLMITVFVSTAFVIMFS